MADIKISQLGAAIAVGDTDLVPIVSGGNTLKATAAQVKEHSIGNTNISGIGDGSVTGAISALNTDKQPKTLDTPLTIGGASKTTVEEALGGLNTETQSLSSALTTIKNSIAPTEDGTNYSTSYSKGAQFYHNGVLREVTASSVNTSNDIASTSAVVDSITEQIGRMFYAARKEVEVYGDGTKNFALGSTNIALANYTPYFVGGVSTDRKNMYVYQSYFSGNTLYVSIFDTTSALSSSESI